MCMGRRQRTCPVGRDPCVPPQHTHYSRRGTRAPPYRVRRSYRADRVVRPYKVGQEPCETGRRTPRAFVPLRSTAGRRPLRAGKGCVRKGRRKRRPLHYHYHYSAWPLCFMTDTTSSTQARQRASSGASTMTRSSGSVPDSRTRMRPVSPRRRATPSTAFCTAGS